MAVRRPPRWRLLTTREMVRKKKTYGRRVREPSSKDRTSRPSSLPKIVLYLTYPCARNHCTALLRASRGGVWGNPSSRTAFEASKNIRLRDNRTPASVTKGGV